MNKKVISSLAVLLLGTATTAFADSYYHSNINVGPVSAITDTYSDMHVRKNFMGSQAIGADMYFNNTGSRNDIDITNKNKGSVSAATTTDAVNVKKNTIDTLALGATTSSLDSKGWGNDIHITNKNKGSVSAGTETIAYGNVTENGISTRAFGANTELDVKGRHNSIEITNKNTGNIQAVTNTFAYENIKKNTISTVAIGANVYLEMKGSDNYLDVVNKNKGNVSAVTNTEAYGNIKKNAISTQAIGASLSMDLSSNSRRHGGNGGLDVSGMGGGYYSDVSSFNLNTGNVAAQTNTTGYNVTNNTISTLAIGATTSISTRTTRSHGR